MSAAAGGPVRVRVPSRNGPTRTHQHTSDNKGYFYFFSPINLRRNERGPGSRGPNVVRSKLQAHQTRRGAPPALGRFWPARVRWR